MVKKFMPFKDSYNTSIAIDKIVLFSESYSPISGHAILIETISGVKRLEYRNKDLEFRGDLKQLKEMELDYKSNKSKENIYSFDFASFPTLTETLNKLSIICKSPEFDPYIPFASALYIYDYLSEKLTHEEISEYFDKVLEPLQLRFRETNSEGGNSNETKI